MEEVRQEKRKRVVQACSTCQIKKIRCDGKQPACSYCLNHSLNCIFVSSQKRRGPRKRRSTSINENLEERLVRMEMLLNDSRNNSTNSSNNLSSPTVSEVRLEDGASSSGMNSNTPGSSRLPVISENGPMPSQRKRGYSLPDVSDFDRPNANSQAETEIEMEFSPPVQWIMEKAQDQTVINGGSLSEAGMFQPLRVAKGNNILPTEVKWPVYGQLAQKEEIVGLVELFFHSYNRFLPLFDPPSFMALLDRQYSGEPDNRVGWWASLNSVIAIAILMRGTECGGGSPIGEARGYVHNAFGVLTELTMRSPDLLNVQALLTLAVLMQGNGDPQATAMLVTFALRLLNILELHRKPGFMTDPVTARQSRRAFWIACTLDRELSMVLKLPLIQNPGDIHIDLPEEDPPDGLGDVSHSEGGKVNIFRLLAELSEIQAEVHQGLYTTVADRQSREDLVQIITNLDQRLEEWKVSIPLDFQPEYEIKTSDCHLRQYVIALHFNYYNCLSNIHHACLSFGKGSQISPKISCQIISSRALYMSAARAMIRLTRYISKDTPAFVWRVLCYPILATITLLVGIRDDPNQPRALSDITLLSSMVNFLSAMEDMGINTIQQIRRVCLEFERVARETVDKACLKRPKLSMSQSADRMPLNINSIVTNNNNQNEDPAMPSGVSSNTQLDDNLNPTFNVELTPFQQKNLSEFSNNIDSADRIPTSMPMDNFSDTILNGYLDQDAIFGTVPFWNSENLHENLLAEFLPQYYGNLDMSLGLGMSI